MLSALEEKEETLNESQEKIEEEYSDLKEKINSNTLSEDEKVK